MCVATCADCLLFSLPLDLYGTAGWASGASDEVEDVVPSIPVIPATPATPSTPSTPSEPDASWPLVQKAFFFGVIVSAVAIYIKVSKKREAAQFEKISNLA